MSKKNILRLKFTFIFMVAILTISCSEDCKFDSIVTETLPEATIGIEYSYRIELETSCSAPFRKLEQIDGSLPKGITLETTGELKGTPTESGSFTFKIKARVCFSSNGFEYTDCVDKTKELTLIVN